MSRAVTRIWGASGSLSGAAPIVNVTQPTKFDLIVVVLHIKSATIECTGIALATGTFARIARQVGATSALEVWVGYNFDDTVDTSMTMTMSGSIAQVAYANCFRNGAAQTVAPTTSVVGATGATGPMNAGDVTPTADDETQVVIAAAGHLATTVPTYTHTPGGMETFVDSAAIAGTAQRATNNWRTASSLSAHNLTATTTVEWAAVNALITPTAPVVHATSHLYKGRLTSTLDDAAVA